MGSGIALAIFGAAIVLFALIIIGTIMAKLYCRATKEMAFVRTGFGGQKVIMNGGALVFPILHEIIQVNMNTLRLEVKRADEQALITRDRMRVDVQASEDLLKNGLELEAVSLTGLDQTSREYFNPDNAFDAQGLTKLTEQIEARRKQRNDIEQDTEVQIKMKNLDAEKKKLEVAREEEYAPLSPERQVEVRRASQAMEIAKESADKERESKEAEIAAKQKVDEAQKMKIEAQGLEEKYKVEAEGKRALHEADNILSEELIAMRIKSLLIENLPAILEQSVKPMENIEGIKIMQVDGLNGGSTGAINSAGHKGVNLANEVVNSALRYRAQAPLVDSLLQEIGLDGSQINGLTQAFVPKEEQAEAKVEKAVETQKPVNTPPNKPAEH